jgi:hypothetical protein
MGFGLASPWLVQSTGVGVCPEDLAVVRTPPCARAREDGAPGYLFLCRVVWSGDLEWLGQFFDFVVVMLLFLLRIIGCKLMILFDVRFLWGFVGFLRVLYRFLRVSQGFTCDFRHAFEMVKYQPVMGGYRAVAGDGVAPRMRSHRVRAISPRKTGWQSLRTLFWYAGQRAPVTETAR